MTVRYVFYGIFTGLTSLLFWYFIGLFCGIYLSSSYGWIKGTFISLSISWIGVGIAVPFIMAVIRAFTKRFPDLGYNYILIILAAWQAFYFLLNL